MVKDGAEIILVCEECAQEIADADDENEDES